MEGDGIGPEVVGCAVKVLRSAEKKLGKEIFKFVNLPIGLKAYEQCGSTFPDKTRKDLQACDCAILGPVSTHLYEFDQNMPNPSAIVRTKFDLYANIRPVRSTPQGKFQGVDLVIVREGTEGMYADRNLYTGSGEIMPDKDTVLSFRKVSSKSSQRIAKTAFEIAKDRGKYISIIHKANVLRNGCGLFLNESRNVGKSYTDIFIDDYHVDAFAMYLVQHPEKYDVILTTNMFGDILSDEAAGLVGGLGFAPGLNAGKNFAIAQAAHGSAPSIAGKNVANPIAEILSASLMIDWLAKKHNDSLLNKLGSIIDKAVWSIIEKNIIYPFDVGGKTTTEEICEAITSEFEENK
jgi:3-isopropylmalate dehydrogenase